MPKDNLFMFKFGDKRNKGLDQRKFRSTLGFPNQLAAKTFMQGFSEFCNFRKVYFETLH